MEFLCWTDMDCSVIVPRTNTIILVDENGHGTFVERTMPAGSMHPDEAEWLVSTHEFDIETDS